MNLQRPNANEATRTTNRSKSVVPMSGICTRCIDGCTGNCEIFKSTFRGRELIYPGPFGDITAVYGAREPGELLYKETLKSWEEDSP